MVSVKIYNKIIEDTIFLSITQFTKLARSDQKTLKSVTLTKSTFKNANRESRQLQCHECNQKISSLGMHRDIITPSKTLHNDILKLYNLKTI